MSENNCRLVKALLGVLYKATALTAIGTVVITLDVWISLAATAAAFFFYYGSRSLLAALCPEARRQEHHQVVSKIRPASPRQTIYPDNVTPFPIARLEYQQRAEISPPEARQAAELRRR